MKLWPMSLIAVMKLWLVCDGIVWPPADNAGEATRWMHKTFAPTHSHLVELQVCMLNKVVSTSCWNSPHLPQVFELCHPQWSKRMMLLKPKEQSLKECSVMRYRSDNAIANRPQLHYCNQIHWPQLHAPTPATWFQSQLWQQYFVDVSWVHSETPELKFVHTHNSLSLI